MIIDYLQVGRAHTAPVEMFGLPIAAYLAGASIIYLPLFMLLGWFVHNAGFGMNSVIDYMYGYDKADPSKQDHPLVSGRMSLISAVLYVFGLQLASVFFFFLLTHSAISILAFAGYVAFGWAYNILAKKNKPAAMIELGLSMGLLFFSVATIYSRIDSIIIAASIYILSTTMYQIGICGDLKDLNAITEERNILREMGVYVDNAGNMVRPKKAMAFGDALSILKAIMIGLTAYFISPLWSVAIFILGILSFLYYSHTAMREGEYNHAWRLKVIGMGEVWGYIIFVIALFPLFISWYVYAFIFFFVLPPMYYYIMNKVMWPKSGSGWAPGV